MLDRQRYEAHIAEGKVRQEKWLFKHAKHKKLRTALPLLGGVPEQGWPGDCGGSWDDFAWGPRCSWTAKERYSVETCRFRKYAHLLYVLNHVQISFLLPSERISVRVIDPFTIKPLDVKTIIDHTRATRGRVLTVEDHYYEGMLLYNLLILFQLFAYYMNVANLAATSFLA